MCHWKVPVADQVRSVDQKNVSVIFNKMEAAGILGCIDVILLAPSVQTSSQVFYANH